MRIIFILVLIFLSNTSWSFIDYKYLICEIDKPEDENLSIDKRFFELRIAIGGIFLLIL